MLTIKIQTKNAAFDATDDGASECARLLRLIADKLEGSLQRAGTVQDYNSNTVGTYTLTNR